MFILKVLGGAAIEGSDGPLAGRPAQKRRLALLSLLAMSPGNRLGREKLIAYLWPEREGESARHLLSDAVYVINRALGSDTRAARQTLARLHALHGRYLPAYELAKVHLALGERDAALQWLERALADRSHSIAFLGVDPQLDALRSDPRFKALETSVRPLE